MASNVSSSGSIFNAAGIEQLIKESMQYRRQPLIRLQERRDTLEVNKGIYDDIKTKLEAVRSAISALTADSGTLNKFVAAVGGENAAGLGVTVGDSDKLSAAKYAVEVTHLAQADRYASTQFNNAPGLSGNLTINGQTISVAAGDSLANIRDKINAVDFAGADVEAVEASIVDNRLVLTSVNTGTAATIAVTDGVGLGFLDPADADGNGVPDNHLQVAQNAQLKVNGLPVSRSSNSKLDDIVAGLIFNLKETGSMTVTVAKDNSGTVSKFKSQLNAVNDLMSHLKLKTTAQAGEPDDNGNPTYTQAPLAHDKGMRSLRTEIAGDMLSIYGGAASGQPHSLADIGVTIGDDGKFKLSDESALTSALENNYEAVSDLLNDVLGRVENRVARYLDGSNAVISRTKSSIDKQLEALKSRIDSQDSLLQRQEEVLRKQFYGYQAQVFAMQYDLQSLQAFMLSNLNSINMQG